MSTSPTVTFNQPAVQADKLTWFRFGALGNKIMMTTDTGEWHALDPDTFNKLVAGELPEDAEDFPDLVQKGFIRNGFDAELHANQIRKAKGFLTAGVTHHQIHLSGGNGAIEMDTAKAIIDHIFTSQASAFTIGLIQGPSPIDLDLVSFIHEFAEQKNQYERRTIDYVLHSALDGLNDDSIGVLVEKRIQVRAMFGGAATVHDALQDDHQGPSHEQALNRIHAINAAAQSADLTQGEYSVFGDVHVGTSAAGKASAIVDGLIEAGICDFQVTPILTGKHAISAEDYRSFFADLLRAVVVANSETTALREVNVDALEARIRNGDKLDSVLMSSPNSTGYNERTYDAQGNIFPSNTALQLHTDGDPMFLLGNVVSASNEDISNHPTIRSLMVASQIDCLPGYQHLWSAPYIGVDPIAAYVSTGDIFTKMPTSAHHEATQVMVESIFLHVMETEQKPEA